VASWGDIALARTGSVQTRRRATFQPRSHIARPGFAAEPGQDDGTSPVSAGPLPGSPAGRLAKTDGGGLAAARRPPDTVRVLVVDDHPLYMELVLRQLAAYDWIEVVGCASNGRDAVTLAAAAAPDAILMDLDMPVLDGIEAIRRIRLRSDVPVFVLTASATELDRGRALAAGARVVLPKTIDAVELAGYLGALLPEPVNARSVARR
jgi:CheY-like chemotaxis protein